MEDPGRAVQWQSGLFTNILLALLGVLLGCFYIGIISAGLSPKISIGALAGLLVCILICVRPDIGLLLTIITIPLEEVGSLGFLMPSLYFSVSKILGLATLAAWFVHVCMNKKKIVYSHIYLLLAGYLFAALMSLGSAWDMKVAVKSVMRVCVSIGFYVLLINMIQDKKYLKRIVTVLLTSYLLIGLFTIVQRYIPYFQVEQQLSAVKFGVLKDVTEAGLAHGEVLRSSGTSYHPLGLALNVVVIFPLFIYMFEMSSRFKKIFWSLAVVIQLVVLYYTYTRTGFMVLIIEGVMLAVYRVIKINPVRIMTLLLALLAVYPFIPERFKNRILSIDSYTVSKSTSLTNRLKMQKKAVEMLPDVWLTGFGIGNQPIGDIVFGDDVGGTDAGTHNMFLEILVQMGVCGLGFMLLFLFYTYKEFNCAIRNFKRMGDIQGALYVKALKVCFLGIVVYGMFYEINNASAKNCWLIFALAVIMNRLSKSSSAAEKQISINM